MAKSKKAPAKKVATKAAPKKVAKKGIKKYKGESEAVTPEDQSDLSNFDEMDGLTEQEKVANVLHNKAEL